MRDDIDEIFKDLNINFLSFLGEKSFLLLGSVIFIFISSFYLYSKKTDLTRISLVMTFFFILIFSYLVLEFNAKKKKYKKLLNQLVDLDKKYLLSQILKEPKKIDDKVYLKVMKAMSRSFLKELSSYKREKVEYKEYIEQWVHEVKTPIAASKLILDNNQYDFSRDILFELNRIDVYVEQVLFYGRSEKVEKDYLVKEINLNDCVSNVIIRNKSEFILNDVELELNNLDINVYSDSKWLEFILNQIIINSLKYKKDENSKIKIFSQCIENSVVLVIEDNGKGILKEDLPRVFEKGFTGIKGRENNKATGIGLYICKNLCVKLGIYIDIDSIYNDFTRVKVTFPKGSFSNNNMFK